MSSFPLIVVESQKSILDINIPEIQEAYNESGLVLLRGCTATRESFRSFTDKLCKNFVSHLNLSREYFGDQTLMTVSAGCDHFFAHSEMAYSPLRPDIAIFYCVQPALKGGETTICDGIELLRHLRSETRSTLEKNKLLFEFCFSPDIWKKLAPNISGIGEIYEHADSEEFFWELRDEFLYTRYLTSAIVTTRWNGQKALSTSLLDQKKPRFSDASDVPREVLWDVIGASEDLMVPVQWQPNDILFVDNFRYMHGRRPWEDNQREIVVRFGNIDF